MNAALGDGTAASVSRAARLSGQVDAVVLRRDGEALLLPRWDEQDEAAPWWSVSRDEEVSASAVARELGLTGGGSRRCVSTILDAEGCSSKAPCPGTALSNILSGVPGHPPLLAPSPAGDQDEAAGPGRPVEVEEPAVVVEESLSPPVPEWVAALDENDRYDVLLQASMLIEAGVPAEAADALAAEQLGVMAAVEENAWRRDEAIELRAAKTEWERLEKAAQEESVTVAATSSALRGRQGSQGSSSPACAAPPPGVEGRFLVVARANRTNPSFAAQIGDQYQRWAAKADPRLALIVRIRCCGDDVVLESLGREPPQREAG